MLPINIPLSLGGEIGIDSASLNINYGISTVTDSVLAVPLLLRAAYHFDLNPKLDLYLVGKFGYVFGAIVDGPDKEYFKSSGGLALGVDIGAAYYFTALFGAFVEGGFDGYLAKTKFEAEGYTSTVDTPFYRFVTFGLSFRK